MGLLEAAGYLYYRVTFQKTDQFQELGTINYNIIYIIYIKKLQLYTTIEYNIYIEARL